MTTRKPAPIVKCEHCNWKGSARGLFTHVRLSHPGISTKPPTATLQHPLDIDKKTSIGSVKRKRKHYSSELNDEINEVAMLALGLALVVKVLDYLPVRQTLQREGINPNQVVKALGKVQ
jgi:hypothetical protein